jgi:hypothetical protein
VLRGEEFEKDPVQKQIKFLGLLSLLKDILQIFSTLNFGG